MINARSETLEEKPSYRNLLNTSRCIIIADGFYEWKVENGIKRKYFIRKEDNSILAMAGLWTSWNSPNGAWINSYTVITSAAKGIISEVHDRMPVLLNKPCQDKWLIKSQEYHTSLLKPEVSGLVLNYAD
jgi:putative SOS response-associated peptidase YedK